MKSAFVKYLVVGIAVAAALGYVYMEWKTREMTANDTFDALNPIKITPRSDTPSRPKERPPIDRSEKKPRRDQGRSQELTLEGVDSFSDWTAPERSACKIDADCVNLADACHFWIPINVKFRERFQIFQRGIYLRGRCAEVGPAKKAVGKGHCANGTCVSDEKT